MVDFPAPDSPIKPQDLAALQLDVDVVDRAPVP